MHYCAGSVGSAGSAASAASAASAGSDLAFCDSMVLNKANKDNL